MLTKPFIKKQSVYVSLNTKILYLVVAVSSKKCPNRPRHKTDLSPDTDQMSIKTELTTISVIKM